MFVTGHAVTTDTDADASVFLSATSIDNVIPVDIEEPVAISCDLVDVSSSTTTIAITGRSQISMIEY